MRSWNAESLSDAAKIARFLGRANPHGGLLYNKGNLYGTTDFNAPSGNLGIVFEITAEGQYTILYNFGGQPGDGTAPCDFGGLAFRGGKLYGTTLYGGATGGLGTVFDLTLKGKERVLHTFGGQPGDGEYPFASVIFDKAGNLYGSTFAGGLYGQGTVFELSPTGEEKILYTFGSQASDGATPLGGLVLDTAGNIYGVTAYGGAYGFGTVFEITP